jgi:HAD superfamily hydrolase (TIGR01484 family)
VQSLAQLPAAEVRSLLGICFDVDDTVTTHGTLDPEAYAAFFALRASGLKLMAVTGRPLGFAEIIARTWPVDAAVGENGAGYIARVGKELRFGYWDPVEVRASQQAQLERIRQRIARELPQVHVSSDAWARRCDLAFDVGEYACHPRTTVDALLALMKEEGAHTSVSSIHAHAQLGAHDKARGIAFAARELWEIAEVGPSFLFVGDSGNDAAAFAHFALTVGVANVVNHLERLPKPPSYVTTASYGAGFAELAREIVRLRS